MKKLLSLFLLTVVLLYALTSCGYYEPTIEVNADGYIVVNGIKTEHRIAEDVSNKIHYPISNMGTKIEALPLSEQQKIDEYVADCKTLFLSRYISQLLQYSRLEDSYLSFTDIFVYDLSKIDENNLDGVSAAKWNDIKALNDGVSAPIMYIELSGFHNYPFTDYYRPAYFSDTGTIYGYFIFENETCAPALYNRLSVNHYNYEMIPGAEFINCGDKYSESKSAEELTCFYESLQSSSSYEDIFKRLTPI